MKRTLTVALFALALIAGPVAAACGSCCAEAAPEAAFAPAQGCCGHCEPTVERSPDPASLTSKGTTATADSHAVLLAPAAGPFSVHTTSRVVLGDADRASAPRVSASPLRL
jgi:hypothetical protein